VIAPSNPHLHAVNPDAELDADDADIGATAPAGPAEAEKRQLWSLAPSPKHLSLYAGGLVAILLGAAIGFWLGRRSALRPSRPVRRATSTVAAAADLAPVALRLLSNPIVRALVVKQAIKQFSRRIAA
jgi:hypothetical protein